MAQGLNYKFNVENIERIEKQIKYIQGLKKMKESKKFQSFIRDKCLETLNKIMDDRLVGTTNAENFDVYRNSNHVLETDNGFVIYNDAKIPAEVKGVQNDVSNYPNGMFNLALAFEYGVGIVGMNTDNPNAWEYNVQGYYFGWVLPSRVALLNGIPTGQEYAGYQGLEIYRYTAEEIRNNLKKWVIEYMENMR